MVRWVNFYRARFALNGFNRFDPGRQRGRALDNACAGQSDGPLLKIGGIGGHDHRAWEVFFGTSPAQGLAMVAAGMSNHSGGGQTGALQLEQGILDPAHLKGPGALEVFAFKKERSPGKRI